MDNGFYPAHKKNTEGCQTSVTYKEKQSPEPTGPERAWGEPQPHSPGVIPTLWAYLCTGVTPQAGKPVSVVPAARKIRVCACPWGSKGQLQGGRCLRPVTGGIHAGCIGGYRNHLAHGNVSCAGVTAVFLIFFSNCHHLMVSFQTEIHHPSVS